MNLVEVTLTFAAINRLDCHPDHRSEIIKIISVTRGEQGSGKYSRHKDQIIRTLEENNSKFKISEKVLSKKITNIQFLQKQLIKYPFLLLLGSY